MKCFYVSVTHSFSEMFPDKMDESLVINECYAFKCRKNWLGSNNRISRKLSVSHVIQACCNWENSKQKYEHCFLAYKNNQNGKINWRIKKEKKKNTNKTHISQSKI